MGRELRARRVVRRAHGCPLDLEPRANAAQVGFVRCPELPSQQFFFRLNLEAVEVSHKAGQDNGAENVGVAYEPASQAQKHSQVHGITGMLVDAMDKELGGGFWMEGIHHGLGAPKTDNRREGHSASQ